MPSSALTPEVLGGQIDPHYLPLAAWSVAHDVGVFPIVSLETVLLRFGVLASHRLSVAP